MPSDVEIKPEIKNVAATPVDAAPEKTNSDKPKSFTAAHTMSKGEKVFEWTVYRGMNYWVNLISSVILTDWFINRGGRAKLRADKVSEFIAKILPGSKTHAQKTKFANDTFDYLALTSGGTLLVWPLKIAEDNKRKIVHWLNDKLGVDQTAPDGHKLTPDEIYIEKEQPKQGWFNVIWRRALGMAAVGAGGHLVNFTFKSKKPDGSEVDGNHNVKSFVLNGADGNGGVNRVLSAIPGGSALVKNDRAQAWMGYAVLDSIFTQLTAFIMFITNGAKKKQMPKEIEDCAPVAPVVDAAAAADVSVPKDRSALKSKKPAASGNYVDLATSSQVGAGLSL